MVKLAVVGVDGVWFFFHLRDDDAPKGGTPVALCGTRLSDEDEAVALHEWGTADDAKVGARSWCELCANRAQELGVVLKRDALLTMERWVVNAEFERAFYERFPLA